VYLLGSLRRYSCIVLLRCILLRTVRMTWRLFLIFNQEEDLCVNIFVGNLAFSATEHDLRQLFEQYGVVDKINIITDRDTGRSKGFGFVEMPDTVAAKAAIQGLNGKELDGRALTVNEAKPREPRREPSRSRW
jgi:RNA recognition motif-containing protein